MNLGAQRWRKVVRPLVYFGRYLRHRGLPRETYAADFEDVAAFLLLGEVSRFIDVGANDGFTVSNTVLMALRGARGLCFEPNPVDYQRMIEFYGCTRRIECVPEGLSDRSAIVAMRSDGLLSAMPATEDAGLTNLLAGSSRADAPVISVAVEPLSVWLDRRPEFAQCDLLSIDVEGHELSVLRGVDWQRHPKPARCLVVETHARGGSREWLHQDFDAISALVVRQGYRKVAASINNTFWLHVDDWSEARIVAAKKRLPKYQWFDYPERPNLR